MKTLELTRWKLGWAEAADARPVETADAWVPSDVQLVWQKEKGMPDYHYGRNYREYTWMEKKFWVYATDVDVPKGEGLHAELYFKSIDYRYIIRVDGKAVLEGEGMFTPARVEMDAWQGKCIKVEVVIFPAPVVEGEPEGERGNASHSVKPAVSYGWDWHPHLVPAGISDTAELRIYPSSYIYEAEFSYELNDALDEVTVRAEAEVRNPEDCRIILTLTDENGNTVAAAEAQAAESSSLSVMLRQPALWYPIRRGAQTRYDVKVELRKAAALLDEKGRKIGFRRVRLLRNQEMEEDSFPKPQLPNPITLEINGQRLFCKGTNYVPNEIFYSRMTRERYMAVLVKARDANMNILRVWGGGLTNREDFFDICDEMGLMVWQEFPLACNNYPDDPHYLAVLHQESVSIIKRVRTHPCLALWCGGNELFNSWSGMTNQSLALRLLDMNCLLHDPHTPFMMTSPTCGMGHGHYALMSGEDREPVSDFIDKDFTAYTEFGSPAPAPLDYIKKYCPPDELYRVSEDTAWLDHHALYAWNSRDTWFNVPHIEAYYGKAATLEETVEHGLDVQAVSYKGLFEAARRKWPNTSMAINWCFNEPWPCFANNSLLLYPDLPRPAYFAVKEALRDTMFSAKLYKYRWHTGETAEVELYILHDPQETLPAGHVRVILETGDESRVLYEGDYEAVPGGTAKAVAACSFPVTGDMPKTFTLRVEGSDAAMNASYKLFHV